MNLTKKQKSALIGMILGDGYLQKTGKRNARLRLEHKVSHIEYLIWKAKLLPRLFGGKPQILERKHPLTKRIYRYARWQSNSSPILGKLRKLFYPDPDNKKKIPENLEQLLKDDIAFAIWFYDDGYYFPRNKCSYLYLGKVSLKEAQIAQKAIAQKFNILSKLLDKKDKGYVIYFPSSENKKIKEILQKYYIPIMAYKIPNTPVTP